MKRLLGFVLVLSMVLTFALSANAELDPGTYLSPKAEDYPIDLSEEKVINILLMGDTPQDFDMVLEYINGILKDQYNTTIAPTMVGWSDVGTMYPLLITGGDDLDIVFAQNMRYLFNYAADDMYHVFTEEFIESYMPYTALYQNKTSLSQAMYRGEIVGIPQNESTAGGASFFVGVRDDVIERYGVTDLTCYQDVYDLWMQIAEDGDQTMLALNAGKTDSPVFGLRQQDKGYVSARVSGFSYAWKNGETPTPEELIYTYTSDEYLAAAQDGWALAQAGVWSRSVLSKTSNNFESFYNGDSCTMTFNSTVYRYCDVLQNNTGATGSAFLPIGDGVAVKESYAQNCLCIYAGCPDIERAAMIIDVLKFNTDINHAIIFGLKDYHYTDNGDGTISVTDKGSGFASYSWCPSWTVKNGDLREPCYTIAQEEMHDHLLEIGVDNPVDSFVFDAEPVSMYENAISATITEKQYTLMLGLVDDPEVAYNEFMDALDAAGLETYIEEVISQYTEWYNAL